MDKNIFRDFDEKVNYKKIFFKKYEQGLNQFEFGFKKDFYDNSAYRDKYFVIKNSLDNSITNISQNSEIKTNLKLYFLGILMGAIASLTSLYFQSLIIFFIVLALLIVIGFICIIIWLKKIDEEQKYYWIFLKSVQELKTIGVDFNKRK